MQLASQSCHTRGISVRFDSHSQAGATKSYTFRGLRKVVSTKELPDVISAMKQVEESVSSGFHAAGFVCYEAAPAFNNTLPKSPHTSGLPLVWFAIFNEKLENNGYPPSTHQIHSTEKIIFSSDLPSFTEDIATIKKHIEYGETYQVNHTIRGFIEYPGDPEELYKNLCTNQNSNYSAFIQTPQFQILSASPELFFSTSDGKITMKPMKGTASRHPLQNLDKIAAEALKNSEKERAENLMIVDLIRNDLAIISETGSINVTSLFDIESYPTVHQMTSSVTAKIKRETSTIELFSALFPCGSVTGAPKRRTMEIINRLEKSAREVYCGAIGFISPGGEATFSVGIRTLFSTTDKTHFTLGVGGGITYDSNPAAEYAEALSKASFLNTLQKNDFSLIESILHDSNSFYLLDKHLKRLEASASCFNFKFDMPAVKKRLKNLSQKLGGKIDKVRVLLHCSGEFEITSQQLELTKSSEILKTTLCKTVTDKSNKFLYHKTTNRDFYQNERSKHPDCYDIIFMNSDGEITEGSYNNIVLELENKLLTPPIECGVLPGVMRSALLESGVISEQILNIKDLERADKIFFINSVRGWQECRIDEKYQLFSTNKKNIIPAVF